MLKGFGLDLPRDLYTHNPSRGINGRDGVSTLSAFISVLQLCNYLTLMSNQRDSKDKANGS